MKRLTSRLDPSVNIIRGFPNGTSRSTTRLESRLVIRNEKLCIYVSSQGGCNMGCGQCHLTASGQTSMKPSTIDDYKQQVVSVLDEMSKSRHSVVRNQVTRLNIEFMARGEPLANPYVLKSWSQLRNSISKVCYNATRMIPKFNVSTILPYTLGYRPLIDIFDYKHDKCDIPTIYYSAWSIKDSFKKKWMPGAIPTLAGLQRLADFQSALVQRYGDTDFAQSKVVLHSAFVQGQNDSMNDIDELLKSMKQVGLHARYNMIRYNPPAHGSSFDQYQESSDNHRRKIYEHLLRNNPGGVKTVDRVGLDVFASCGTFYTE